MDAETPQRQSSGSAAKGWLSVVALAILLALTAWFIMRQWTDKVRIYNSDLAARQESNKQLTSTKNRLLEVLQINPCAIPDAIGGLSLLAQDKAANKTKGETTGAQPVQTKP